MEKEHVFSLRINKELYEKLREKAHQARTSINKLIVACIKGKL